MHLVSGKLQTIPYTSYPPSLGPWACFSPQGKPVQPEGFVMEQQGLRSTERYRLLPTYTANLVLELSLPHSQARGR